ncbi:hypothetical protein NPIL_168091 [Nephila pilipes]|uniref:Uncharacterized protein n=1 Tax=Nephila pilipes TaxID=299642 RepID=A0A8X6T3W7_NEPPI|nr:hypothetical protein NPIL_168091 [Nephila pilipes]
MYLEKVTTELITEHVVSHLPIPVMKITSSESKQFRLSKPILPRFSVCEALKIYGYHRASITRALLKQQHSGVQQLILNLIDLNHVTHLSQTFPSLPTKERHALTIF